MSFRELETFGATPAAAAAGATRDGWASDWGGPGSIEEKNAQALLTETEEIVSARAKTIPQALIERWLDARRRWALSLVVADRLQHRDLFTRKAAWRLRSEDRGDGHLREAIQAENAITLYLRTGALPEGL